MSRSAYLIYALVVVGVVTLINLIPGDGGSSRSWGSSGGSSGGGWSSGGGGHK